MLNSRMRSFLIRDILGPGDEHQRDISDKDCEVLHQQVSVSRCPNDSKNAEGKFYKSQRKQTKYLQMMDKFIKF
ncbi:hypothetical protein TNIN_22871 [Trichonephila inaurata madagascariensis]|uniref:Uncharacterized protein n=1 Tax=Trichonephila inaurata madagascariensis TaxID=2747483 RepID=A0A8X7BZ15_9ARAC|nr:hypothetical protein TNIN_22871 [Trichonephila inaurata madagascariensis]